MAIAGWIAPVGICDGIAVPVRCRHESRCFLGTFILYEVWFLLGKRLRVISLDGHGIRLASDTLESGKIGGEAFSNCFWTLWLDSVLFTL